MKPKGASFRPGWIQALREQQVEAICQLSVWLSSALAAPGASSMESPLENSVGGHQASNPRCRGASASRGPPKSQDSCYLATLGIALPQLSPGGSYQPHLGLTAILEPRDGVSPWTHWSERGMVPKGKAGAAATRRRYWAWAVRGLVLAQERVCFQVPRVGLGRGREGGRGQSVPLAFWRGSPLPWPVSPEAHFPHDLGGWVQVPPPSFLPLPFFSHFLGSKRATSSSSCAPHTEHTAGATVCFGLRSAQSSSFPRLMGALPRRTTRQVSPLYSSSRDAGESQEDTVGWGTRSHPTSPVVPRGTQGVGRGSPGPYWLLSVGYELPASRPPTVRAC